MGAVWLVTMATCHFHVDECHGLRKCHNGRTPVCLVGLLVNWKAFTETVQEHPN